MRTLIALSLLLLTFGAHAACLRPTDSAPTIPNGATSDEATMHAAHNAVQAYVDSLEAYQGCLQKQVAEAPSDMTPELKIAWLAEGDAAVDAAQVAASAFSAALKSFKERSAVPPPK